MVSIYIIAKVLEATVKLLLAATSFVITVLTFGKVDLMGLTQ